MKKEVKEIRIGILASEPLLWSTCALQFFSVMLEKYQWQTQSNKYIISTSSLSDNDILEGRLNKTNIDALLIPGGGVGDSHSMVKGFNFLPKTKKWKRNIQEFVKAGGGVIGICGGASLITSLEMSNNRKPTSFVERQYNKSSLDISCVTSIYNYIAFPLFYPFQYNHPERVGSTLYVFSYEPGITKDGKRIHCGGVSIDFQVNKNNPIFADYPYEKLRIRWWGGQGLKVPKNPNRQVSIIASYPSIDLYENEETRINAWKYVGGVFGLIRGFFKAMKFIKQNNLKIIEFPMLTYSFAGDWTLSNTIIETDLKNRPAITTEIYPNDNQGRITLCAAHPEYMIWYGGFLKEKDDTKYNCLGNGLLQWDNIDLVDDSIDKLITHTWWLVRRLVAWTAKVPDCDLPPITNPSLTKQEKETLQKYIYWDGTIINLIDNI